MSSQIRQILRKDWKVLWPVVAIVAALSVLGEWLRYRVGFFGEGQPVWRAMELVEQVSVIGWVVIAAAVVHQDRILGSTQDWLVRPIRRLDLLVAKLAFIVVLVHGPLFVAQAAALVAQGFPILEALGAAASSGVVKLLFYTLPVAAVAAVTRNTMEFLVAGLVIVLLVIGSLGVLWLVGGPDGSVQPLDECGSTTCWTGLAWLADSARMALAAAVAAVVLALQYFRRATALSRASIVAGIVGVIAIGQLPWSLFFALQQAVGGDREAMQAIDVAFSKDARGEALGAPSGRPGAAGASLAVLAAQETLSGAEYDEMAALLRQRRPVGVSVSVPLAVSGLPDGVLLRADRIETRLLDEGGRVVFRAVGGVLQVRWHESVQRFVPHTWTVPPDKYETLRERTLRLEVDYWLTLLEPAGALTLPASGGEGAVEERTLCAAQPSDDPRAVQVRCLAIAPRPSCFAASVEPALSAARREGFLACRPSYAPYGDAVSPLQRFAIDVPPEAEISGARVRIEAYRPTGHFVRRIVEPAFRIGDWAAP